MLDTPPAPGAWNMALDAALLHRVREGAEPVLRFYRWAPACLSLGRNQPARGCYDLDRLREHGWDVVRRPTGGRAVLHDRELTYSVVAAVELLGGPRASYAAINRALLYGLRRLGVPARLQADRRRASAPSLAPCFAEPATGEIVVHGRKLVGSAQVREGGVLLQHGSLLLEDDQPAVEALLAAQRSPGRTPRARPACLAELLDPLPTWPTLVSALAEGWGEALYATLTPEPPSPEELELADELAARFTDPAWTWRC